MGKINAPTYYVRSTGIPATTGAGSAADAVRGSSGVQSGSAEIKLAREEFLRLSGNIKLSYMTLGDQIHKVCDSLCADRKILGCRSLFKFVSLVSDKLENICRLEKGRLTSKLVKNTPFSCQIDQQVKSLTALREAVEKFHVTVAEVSNPDDHAPLTETERSACTEGG